MNCLLSIARPEQRACEFLHLFGVDRPVDGVAQEELGHPDVVRRRQAVCPEDRLALEEGVPVGRHVDDVLDPRKGDADTPCLDLHEHHCRAVGERQQVAEDVLRQLPTDLLHRPRVDEGTRVLAGHRVVHLDPAALDLARLAVEDLVRDSRVSQALGDQRDLVLEVRDHERRLVLRLVCLDHLEDVVDLGDPRLVPLRDVVVDAPRPAPDLLGVEDDLRVDRRLALAEHLQDDHRADDVVREVSPVRCQPLRLVVDPLRHEVVHLLLLRVLELVDVLANHEFGTGREDLRAEFPEHQVLEDRCRRARVDGERREEERDVGVDVRVLVVVGCRGDAPPDRNRPGEGEDRLCDLSAEIPQDVCLVDQDPLESCRCEPGAVPQNGLVRCHDDQGTVGREIETFLELVDVEGKVANGPERVGPVEERGLGRQDQGPLLEAPLEESRCHHRLAESHLVAEESAATCLAALTLLHPRDGLLLIGVEVHCDRWYVMFVGEHTVSCIVGEA